MKLKVEKSSIDGKIRIPGSKSHTIRGVIIASLADGESQLKNPLDSMDTKACVHACKALGAKIEKNGKNLWKVQGFNGKPETPENSLNLMNSGTTTSMILGLVSHAKGPVVLTGDDSLKTRPFDPLIKAINDLGGNAKSLNDNGKLPIEVSGFLEGGYSEIDGMNSQPISSLLVNSVLCEKDTEIYVPNLHEKPYVRMTMQWLDELNIKYKENGMTTFKIKGNQSYNSFEKSIPADFSSATFPLCAGVILDESSVLLKGLDLNDSQGDKAVIDMLKDMGANITIGSEGIRVKNNRIDGCELDLNNTPDALPALAVVGCFAEGETRLVNVAQARIKKTDRITAMREELEKMGANIEELDDGLIIRKSHLKGNVVDSRGDHRMAMALSLAGMKASGKTVIKSAESINVTFPSYVKKMKNMGANMELVE